MFERQHRSFILAPAALLLATMIGALFAGPRHAFCDEPPDALGIPGLHWAHAVPTSPAPPFRVGLQYGYGNYDPEGGLAVDLGRPDLRSQQFDLQLQIRAATALCFSANVPLRQLSLEGGESVFGFGDIQGAFALRMFGAGLTSIGSWGSLNIPSGDEGKGLTTKKIDGEIGVVTQSRFFTGGFAPRMDLIFNVGYRWNKNEKDGYGWQEGPPSEFGGFFPIYPAVADGRSVRENDQLLLRAALLFRQRWGAIFVEWSADWFSQNDEVGFSESPSWVTPGVVFGDGSGPSLKASWSIGFAEDSALTAFEPRTPDWYARVAVNMPLYLGGRDRDEDLVRDKDDACPDQPEDLDGYQDEDGCPDVDNDGDGIEDRVDLAPNLAEDFDGFQDEDGRPDLDNDLDGIPDDEDACPNQPEDFDGDRDIDGCPDLVEDVDGDGIADGEDACPDQAEDQDGYEDADGCPDDDNDLDGIRDADDACPDEAEDYDGDRDEDGCPDRDDAQS